MEKNFLLSIVVPVYNAEKYLKRAMDSLIGQTVFSNMEIIAVDDGSKDESGKILDGYACRYHNISVFHIPNGGVSNARNLGMEQATGEYLGFLDADDWLDVNHFERLLNAARNGIAEVVACGFAIETDNNTVVKNDVSTADTVLEGKAAVKAFLLGQIDVHAVTKIYRTELIRNFRFDPDLHYGEDRLFALSALLASNRVALVKDCFYHYYLNSQSAMQQRISDRSFENLTVGKRTIDSVAQIYPDLVPYAECEDISTKCRLAGEIVLQKKKSRYPEAYKQMRRDIRAFDIRKAYRYSSKKHFLSLVIAKISPWLYGKLRNVPVLRFKK